MENMQSGIVNCLRLPVHEKPSLDSDVVCKLRYLTEVEIVLAESTKNFYKIYTAIGAEGFCLKEQIVIK